MPRGIPRKPRAPENKPPEPAPNDPASLRYGPGSPNPNFHGAEGEPGVAPKPTGSEKAPDASEGAAIAEADAEAEADRVRADEAKEAKSAAKADGDKPKIIVNVRPQEGELVQVRVTKAGAGRISTGDFVHGDGNVYFEKGDLVMLPKAIADDLESKHLVEIQDDAEA